MDETSQVRAMFGLLEAGQVEAATRVFEEYLQQRINVGDEQALRATWARMVTTRVAELAAEQAAREAQRPKRLFRRG
jgi:hypothetical protein